MQLNGVVLISSILNYAIRSPGYDKIYIFNLPSYAAAAWYFDKIPNKPADVPTWVQQAREFASGPYAQALFQGHNLSAAQLDYGGKGGEPLDRAERGLRQGGESAHFADPVPQRSAARRPQDAGPL